MEGVNVSEGVKVFVNVRDTVTVLVGVNVLVGVRVDVGGMQLPVAPKDTEINAEVAYWTVTFALPTAVNLT